ncbi:hypothetical protein HDU98_000750 [Podochytrium sp. JEL0797]|nr:hypothetical protein HDU98_000750 [Podochytrium sp. JEL0797]
MGFPTPSDCGVANVEIRRLSSPADAAAAARVTSLAYSYYSLYLDANLPPTAERTLKRITALPDYQYSGIFHASLEGIDTESFHSLKLGSEAMETRPTPGLIAVWAHRDFESTLFGQVRRLGGLGAVAVDLMHKKRGCAKVLVTQWLHDCFAKEQYLAILHPFRPDFYMKMGFGLSSPYYDYTISPASLPKSFVGPGGASTQLAPTYFALKELRDVHVDEMVACQNRFSDQRHGMIRRMAAGLAEQAFSDKGATRVLGFRDTSNMLRGYILFKFETTSVGASINNIKIIDWIYETTESLYAFTQFLREQDDQIQHIQFTTQDADFFRLLSDPRAAHALGEGCGISASGHQSAKQTVSLMYRVVNIEKLFGVYFADRDFNGVDGVKLFVRVLDTLTPEMNPPVLLGFKKGAVKVLKVGERGKEGADAVLDIGIAEFSSLVVGAVSLKVLVRYGKANVAPKEKLNVVARIFASEDLPVNSVFF